MTWRSFICAVRGIAAAVRKGKNIRVMFVFTGLVVALGFIFGVSLSEWAILLLCCALVVAVEMLNTAIECVVDMVSPNYSESAKKAKDVAAGAVLVASLFAAAVGLIIFVPYIAALAAS